MILNARCRRLTSGYVEMTQVQAGYIGCGNAGTGTLTYRGHTYPFTSAGSALEGSAFQRSRRGVRSMAGAPPRLPGRLHSGALRPCRRHCKHRRPVAQERQWGDYASSRKAARTDAKSGRRCGRDPNEPVTSCVVVGWLLNPDSQPSTSHLTYQYAGDYGPASDKVPVHKLSHLEHRDDLLAVEYRH